MADKEIQEAVGHLLFHLSMVNQELGRFFINNGHDDAGQQEEYAVDWAQKLDALVEGDGTELQMYEESVEELGAIRTHTGHLLRGETTLGKEVYDKLIAVNPKADLNTDRSLGDMAKDLNIGTSDAANLKAFLAFKKFNEQPPEKQ